MGVQIAKQLDDINKLAGAVATYNQKPVPSRGITLTKPTDKPKYVKDGTLRVKDKNPPDGVDPAFKLLSYHEFLALDVVAAKGKGGSYTDLLSSKKAVKKVVEEEEKIEAETDEEFERNLRMELDKVLKRLRYLSPSNDDGMQKKVNLINCIHLLLDTKETEDKAKAA